MRLPPPAIRCPASAGISGISLCIRSRMVALTEFIAVAVRARIGASVGSLRVSGTTSALMDEALGDESAAWQAWNRCYRPGPMATQPNDRPTDEILAGFRKSIDNIDAALIHMLAERFRITKEVGDYKARVSLPPADPAREEQQIKRLRS